MGKQLNYIMDYESFVQLSQYALELGCLIIVHQNTPTPSLPCSDLSVVVPEYSRYCFYLPELYPMDKISHEKDCHGKYYLSDTFGKPFSLSFIEAGFSRTETDRARVYIPTGYYEQDATWVARPELLTKTYDKIARKARKLSKSIIR